MTRYAYYLFILPAWAFATSAAGQSAPATEPPAAPKIVNLTLSPAPETVPAFKHRLRIHYMDQKLGNAALQYYSAITLAQGGNKPEDDDRIVEWLDLPPEKLPVEAVRELLDRYNTALKQTRLAAHYDHCDWEYPLREQGADTLLPGLSPFRKLARLTALSARLAIAQNRLDDALDDLQTGYAMARHACESPVLIGDLVGYAILGLTNRQTLAWIQAPQAGNLYWAIADIPNPFKDPRLLLGGEEGWIFYSFPALRERHPKLSPAEWTRIAGEIDKLVSSDGQQHNDWERKLSATAIALKRYPQAKKELLASGHDAKEVEAMSAAEVVLVSGYESYVRQRDDMFKWFCLPYFQARTHLVEVEKKLSNPQDRLDGYPFVMLLPALTRAYYTTTRGNRELAALRCIEALRWYAAANNGQLPSSLAQVKAVPLPIDPITGQDFVYKLEGNQATLIAAQPEGESPKEETRYVLTVRKP